ncbi:MAG: YggS family pyridoxal phosphate-dependent enzyme [Chloroflexota bacterium]|nr:YggS family pyridoxal phosphate-dependent enzyme [Dehalococcoidia bacterium]MDW8252572.1 YggS family pyridoxal phosphate-dependent enzyme [Chloroflexota bacterium]
MTLLADRLARVRDAIAAAAARSGRPAEAVRLVAVTKTVPVETIAEAYALGVRDFGENRVQEGQPKIAALAAHGIRPTWHFVGHLQTNKAAAALRCFDILQSVDSLRLAETLSRRARGAPVRILLEVNVAGEPSKFGFRLDDPAQPFADALAAIRALPGLVVEGLMTVAPLTDNPESVRPVFRRLAELAAAHGLAELSMGMTDDFPVAIEEGATMVRIGRALFGERPPH